MVPERPVPTMINGPSTACAAASAPWPVYQSSTWRRRTRRFTTIASTSANGVGVVAEVDRDRTDQ